MTVWFTSDLHIGHRMVAGLRGFADTASHDDDIAVAWDDVVREGDQVWILGDLSAGGGASWRNALEWLNLRRGDKHLVAGNHDPVHPMHRDAHKHHGSDVLRSAAQSARRRINGTEVLLSHFPYSGDHTERQRFDQWRLPDHGVPILHGHSHSREKLSRSPAGTLQIHVGIDAWRQPVSLDVIADILAVPF